MISPKIVFPIEAFQPTGLLRAFHLPDVKFRAARLGGCALCKARQALPATGPAKNPFTRGQLSGQAAPVPEQEGRMAPSLHTFVGPPEKVQHAENRAPCFCCFLRWPAFLTDAKERAEQISQAMSFCMFVGPGSVQRPTKSGRPPKWGQYGLIAG